MNYFWCCRGLESTYEIRVGRGASFAGPFADREGVDMARNGGTLVLRNRTRTARHLMVGPGHAGIVKVRLVIGD